MAVLLALVSALTYGVSDFVGGLLSRRASAWPVAVVGATSTAVFTALAAVFVPGDPRPGHLAWALLAGLGSGAGTGFLYRGFASGRMGVVAPVSAVGAAIVPVVAGVLGGERPAALVWTGIALALPAIWLVASEPAEAMETVQAVESGAGAPSARRRPAGARRTPSAAGLVDGLLAGLGFGVLFAALGQVPDSAGLWPLALTQAVSVPAVIVLAVALRASWVPREPAARRAVVLGPIGCVATASFLLATQQGYLAVAGVLASLYPGTTVLLAALLLRERIHRTQGMGLLLCVATVVLVVVG